MRHATKLAAARRLAAHGAEDLTRRSGIGDGTQRALSVACPDVAATSLLVFGDPFAGLSYLALAPTFWVGVMLRAVSLPPHEPSGNVCVRMDVSAAAAVGQHARSVRMLVRSKPWSDWSPFSTRGCPSTGRTPPMALPRRARRYGLFGLDKRLPTFLDVCPSRYLIIVHSCSRVGSGRWPCGWPWWSARRRGLGGTPSAGHRPTAVANASAAASSTSLTGMAAPRSSDRRSSTPRWRA